MMPRSIAFCASNNLCGFHFFIIQPIRLKYLVVTSGLNLNVAY